MPSASSGGRRGALPEVALLAAQSRQLGFLLDALAERLEPERPPELDERVDESAGLLRGGDARR